MSEAWKTDPAAAFLEAEARIARLIAEDGDVLDLSDLPALGRLPDLTGAETLREAYLGDRRPDGTETPFNNALVDLSSIGSATRLTSLSLPRTKVSDLSVLSSLTGLKSLDLSFTPVSDLSVLSGLTGLTSLNLSFTPVSDLGALSDLTGLTSLNLSGRRVSDFGALSGLTGLTSLNLSGTPVSDLGVLSGLTGLTSLNLSGTPVSDLGVLSGLTGLTSLNISRTQVSDLGVLSGLTGLTSLNISDTQVSDLGVLSGLTGLTSLDLSDTQVSDLGVLSGLTGLTSLNISRTQVSHLGVLLSLPNFEAERALSLSFSGTPVAAGDNRLGLLSRLQGQDCARQTVQYLKGTHPDFRPPDTVVQARSPEQQLADAAPVDLIVADGQLDAVNPSPPARLAPNERTQRITALRHLTARLVMQAERAQITEDDRQSLRDYDAALAAEEPTYILLQASMAFLRGAPLDPEFREACNPRLVSAWEELIVQHDALGPLLVPEEDDTSLPELPPETTPEEVAEIVDDIAAAMEEARQDGLVTQAAVDAAQAANRFAKAGRTTAGYLKRALILSGGMAAKMTGEVGKGAAGAIGGSVVAWLAATPAGRALIEKLGPLVQAVLKLFGLA